MLPPESTPLGVYGVHLAARGGVPDDIAGRPNRGSRCSLAPLTLHSQSALIG